jgi:hypothetical protein
LVRLIKQKKGFEKVSLATVSEEGGDVHFAHAPDVLKPDVLTHSFPPPSYPTSPPSPPAQINNWSASVKKQAERTAAAAAAGAGKATGTGRALHAINGSGQVQQMLLARGRKPQLEFENALLQRLVYMVLEKSSEKLKDSLNDEERENAMAGTVANCMYSYELVRLAAEEERTAERWKSDQAVQRLKFSDGWVRGVLDRYKFSRRRCTGVAKSTRPSPEAVRGIMTEIQALLRDEKIPLGGTWSVDE